MKFFVFIAIVVSLWYVMRWVQQAALSRRTQQQERAGHMDAGRRPQATDMVGCPRCRTYVSSEFPTSCGRSDCPFPGVG